MKIPLPPDESQRLESLRQYAVLDTPRDEVFDELTELAAYICEAPIALITLIDENRQWFKSKVGLDISETARDIAFCAHAIHHPELFIVPDAKLDPRFANNPLVLSEPYIRFYAGAPLCTPEGHALGTLCVIDHEPRDMRPDHKRALRILSRHVVTQFEIRRNTQITANLRAERDQVLATLQQERAELEQRVQRRTDELLENGRQLTVLMANLPGYIYRVANNSDYTPIFISEGVEQVTGYTQWEYLVERTINCGAEIHIEDRELVWQTVQSALESFSPYECEYRIFTKSGELRWVWERGRGIYGTSKELLFLEGFVTDVTSRKHAEHEIRRLNIELEQRVAERTHQLETSNRELESFAYSVSHDLRTPLRNISGFSQVLVEDYADRLDEQAQDFLFRIRTAAQRMGLLIDDLLKLSRLSRQDMLTQDVNLSEIVGRITAELQLNAADRQVNFRLAPDITVRGDARLLEIALNNLLHNAWKYTGNKPIANIEFGSENKNGEIVYFVRDNGAGFDMRYASKLFGAFQRLHSAEEFDGTGIGLATVARIIQRHGGKIWADSVVGQGATFYFTLPTQRNKLVF